ncbi:hypothetical protein MMC18_007280, partial [Xylographa bjoerkii]|nr:hypothetical protein [Xylographa bjoerkii]
MPYPNKPSELHFMVKTGVDKFNPEDRRLIRSHVMKGKNLGKIRPPRRRRDLNWADLRQDVSPSLSSFSDTASHNKDRDGSSLPRASSYITPISEYYPIVRSPAPIPHKFGSVVSAISFADSVKPATIEIVLQFSSIAKQLLFPLETCIFFEKRAENWIAPLAVDPAYLHAKIFTSLYYFDVILPQRSSHESQRTLHHHHKALSLLRERILYGNNDSQLSNNTVSVVLSLAGHAFWTGDLKSATNHMEGMRKIANLRGGLNIFRDNEKLLAEILRCDLGIAVHSGAKPIFFNSAPSSEPCLPYPALTLFLETRKPDPATKSSRRAHSATIAHDIEIDGELATAWIVLSDFCSVVNFAADSEQRITVGTFLDTMGSVMYRLLDMHFEVASNDETIRLGLLCFSCSVFLQWQHLGMSYSHLASLFRGCFVRLTATSSQLSPQLVLWLLMAGSVSVFDGSDDVWFTSLLHETIGTCKVESWSEMRDLLISFLWIGLAHDKTGKRVFDSAV